MINPLSIVGTTPFGVVPLKEELSTHRACRPGALTESNRRTECGSNVRDVPSSPTVPAGQETSEKQKSGKAEKQEKEKTARDRQREQGVKKRKDCSGPKRESGKA